MSDPHELQQRFSKPVMLKASERIADAWRLTIAERRKLLKFDQATYDKWKASPSEVDLSDEQINRISQLLVIYDGLHRLFGDETFADEWVRRDNRAFGGKPALRALLSRNPAGFKSVFDHIMCALNI